MRTPKRRRSLTARVIASGLLQAIAPDAAIALALLLIGVTVYRLSPDLVWGYAGVVVLVPGVAIAVTRSKADTPERKGA